MSTRARFALCVAVTLLAFSAFAAPVQLIPGPETITVREIVDGRMICRVATPEEARAFRGGDASLHVIYPERGQVRLTAGLQITLLGTDQLEANPTAKAAFIRAAQTWEARIANPVAISIKADFGTTRFGTPYPSENILGSANGKQFFVNYTAARGALVTNADNATETTLYNLLPASSVPTDRGAGTQVLGTMLQLKTLGFEGFPADVFPDIGFNSSFDFDFDPSNGITPGTLDFDGVAVHEMGHILGFGSVVGLHELDSEFPIAPTIWDLFRFRPGVTQGTFQTAQRPMASGGDHVSFLGGTPIQMSTGRPDGEGGDGQQSSHWKDNTNGNPLIGLMDPTIPSSFRGQLSQNDLDAFNMMGYDVTSGSTPGTPAPNAPTNLTATGTSTTVIRLNWTDNSSNEDNFQIEQKVGANFVSIGTAAANATQINVTGFTAGASATFRIRASNAAGFSGYSNEATGTTLTGTGGGCTPNSTTVCLLSNRFRVSIAYVNPFSNPPNQPGNFLGDRLLQGVQNPDTALFGFSSPQAVEVVVRIQDTRPFAPRFDIYYGGMTDVGYTVTVTDTQTGTTRQYTNTAGRVGGGVDRSSFPASLFGGDDNRVMTSGGKDSFYAEPELMNGGRFRAFVKGQRNSGAVAERRNNDTPVSARVTGNVGGGAACSESEPNGSSSTADPMALGDPCSGSASEFDGGGDIVIQYDGGDEDMVEDLFSITLPSAAKVTVTLNAAAQDLDVFLFRINTSTVDVLGIAASTALTETFTTAATLPAGTYYVGVSAYEGSSTYTVNAVGVGLSSGPAAPSNLAATGTSTSIIRLTWTDNSNDENEFRVEQKSGANFVDIGAAAANATSINVTGFQPSTSGTFRIRARRGTDYSAYSNEATGTTLGTGGTGCTPNSTTVCLLSNRFRVKIDYVNPFSNPPNQPGTFLAARLLQGTQNPDTGLFGFGSAQAVEVVVRVQDTRPFAPRFDIYYGGMTDVGYTVTVTDTQTGTTRQYTNTAGTVGGGVDRTSFPAN